MYLNQLVAAQRLNTEEGCSPVSPVEYTRRHHLYNEFIFLPEMISKTVSLFCCCTFAGLVRVYVLEKHFLLSGCLQSAVALYRLCPSALLFSHTKGFTHCRPTDHANTAQDI